MTQHWLLLFLFLYGIFNLLPFAAPVLMKLGWTAAGNLIYDGYSFLCHQMAQRSFFLFGDKLMYNANQLPLALTGRAGSDTALLRHLRGNEAFGWKVAWSDRMVSLYAGVWFAALVYWIFSRRREIRPASPWLALVLALPMVLDGGTHMISDQTGGLTGGFRYTNDWLAALSGHTLPASFYMGDSLGSFNSWMRLLSGALFATGVVWFCFPYLDRYARHSVEDLDRVLRQAEAGKISGRESGRERMTWLGR
jgi:uncharacterized membrane protein